MKKIILLLLFCGVTAALFAQDRTISGKVTDSSNDFQLRGATVSLLQAKDSFLYQYTRVSANGEFLLHTPDTGDFILLVEYPGYADLVEPVTVKGENVSLGNIFLRSKAQILQEVVVTSRVAAIRIKGDTTEFKADSFKVQPNASVEDLLKKLPGIQIDRDGQITAQGQTVKKVLVDGEEFFGDDPTLVTRNLRADIVDKVQVYDKKSDQAAFTGIDDGVKDKTINIKIKEDQKKGSFGKISVGGGNKGFHESQAMVNKFNNKEKIGLYGIVSNNGKAGLGWMDNQSYGSGDNMGGSDDGIQIVLDNGSDDIGWDGNYNGQGIPLVQTGGIHYNNKWKEDKYSINGNYKINNLSVKGSNEKITQNSLGSGIVQTSNSNGSFDNKSLRNKLNGTFEVQLDSTSSLKVYVEGQLTHKNTFSSDTSFTADQDDALVNAGNKVLTYVGNNNYLNSNILWRKKLGKVGRTISFNVSQQYNTVDLDGHLYNHNIYFNTNVDTLTDQRKSNKSNALVVDTKLTYTEPLSKHSALIANYGVVIANSEANKRSYNYDGASYDLLDSTYSNNFQFNQLMHRTGIAYNYATTKIVANVGSNVGFNKYHQEDIFTHTVRKRNFVNWYPQATLKYSITSSKRLDFQYRGTTAQPTITQIQPIQTNEDPLNVYVGNEELKPSFTNNYSLGFRNFQMMTSTFINVNLDVNQILNDITTNTYTDATTGKNTYQYTNVNGNYNANLFGVFGRKVAKIDAMVGFSARGYWSRSKNLVNEVFNNSNSGLGGLGLFFQKTVENKYDIDFRAEAAYNVNKNSLQSSLNNNYWIYTLTPAADVYLPAKFQLHSDLNYQIRQKTAAFNTNTNVALLSAWIGKKFLKDDQLLLKFSGNDLLNQNKGFSRTVNTNLISQNIYTTIRRYFMLSIVWNFKSGMGQTPTEPKHF